MHGTINSAEECEVRGERRDIGIEFVVHFYREQIVRAGLQKRGRIKNEGRESAAMFAKAMAVHPHFRDAERTVEFEEQMAAGISGVHFEMFSIPARAAIVIGAAVLAVEGVPRVRDVDGLPFGIAETGFLRAGDVCADETPAFVEVYIGAMAGWRRECRRSEHCNAL